MSQVAQTILHQIGGNRFIAMTGAKDFVGGEDKLVFSLNGNLTKNRINRVVITLMPNDTYEMQFIRLRGSVINIEDLERDVYCDMLEEAFERCTGLLTSFSGRRVA